MSVYVWENVARLWKCVCGGFVRERVGDCASRGEPVEVHA